VNGFGFFVVWNMNSPPQCSSASYMTHLSLPRSVSRSFATFAADLMIIRLPCSTIDFFVGVRFDFIFGSSL
jgi:hypothetical protein